MTTESYSKDFTNRNNKKIIDTLNYIVNALEGFRNDYTKKFNFTKLMEYLNIAKSEIDDIFNLILNFQDKFNDVFNNHVLKKKINNGNLYLIAEKKKISVQKDIHIPEIINIKQSDLPIFSDLIYLFKFVKRGKGFEIESNRTDLLRNLKKLWQKYPYLFEEKENGLIYPSELGLKFGELILSFSKNNKEITDVTIDTYSLKVIQNE
ncbi:MAG: hypothetical protein ACFFAQ_04005 [Promethearchaeota archaeon]